MSEIHRPAEPPPGQWVNSNGHTPSKDCVCEPVRHLRRTAVATGRFGKHQGYHTEVVWIHRELPGQYVRPEVAS